MTDHGPTVENLRMSEWPARVHGDMAHGGGFWTYYCERHPRLTMTKRRETGRAPWITTMAVDELHVKDLHEAAAALQRTPEENNKMAEQDAAPQQQQQPAPKKWRLDDGLGAVEQWKDRLAKMNPTLIARGQITEQEANTQVEALAGLLTFLQRCKDNEGELREFWKKMAQKQRAA